MRGGWQEILGVPNGTVVNMNQRMGGSGVWRSPSWSLCETCSPKTEVVARAWSRFSKCPPQPVVRFEGHAHRLDPSGLKRKSS